MLHKSQRYQNSCFPQYLFFLKNKTTIYILPYSINTITKRLKHEFLGNLAMDRFLVTIFQWSKVHFSLWFPKHFYWAWFACLRSHTGKVLFSRLFSLSCKLTPSEPTIFQYLSWTPLQLKVFPFPQHSGTFTPIHKQCIYESQKLNPKLACLHICVTW